MIFTGVPAGCAYFSELENSSAVMRPSGNATVNGTMCSGEQATENDVASGAKRATQPLANFLQVLAERNGARVGMSDEAMQLRNGVDPVGNFHQKSLRIIRTVAFGGPHANEAGDHRQTIRDPVVGFSAQT